METEAMTDHPNEEVEAASEGKDWGVLGFIQGQPNQIDEWDADRVSTYPHLVSREFLAFGALFAVLLLLSLTLNAPLEEMANPSKTPNPAKAPWYFLSLQELLHYSPPLIAGVVTPALLVMTVCLIPLFKGRMSLFPLGFLNIALIAPMLDDLIWEQIHRLTPGFADSIRVYGLPTFAILIAAGFGLYGFILSPRFDDAAKVERTRRRWFLSFVGILVVLVLIGQFFRGPEWRWVWPWA